MRYFLIIIFLLTAGIACKPRVIAGKELENKLSSTMKDYLDSTLKPGTQVTIEKLEYYVDQENKEYICHFTVKLHSSNTDTTGIMIATIPNDFSEVKRWK